MRISMKEIWCNLDGPPKNKELRSYVVKFEFSRWKVAQTNSPVSPDLSRVHDGFPLNTRCVLVEISTKPYPIADYTALGSNHSVNSLQPIGGKRGREVNFLVCILSDNSLRIVCE